MATPVMTLLDEHLFWLEILQDHAYFVRDHLSVTEGEYVQTAQSYIDLFGELILKLNRLNPQAGPASPEMVAFAKEVWPVAQGYFAFEGRMQNLRMQNKVNLNLSPTYLNGTLGENQEYLRLLTFLVQGQDPTPLTLVELLDLWLEDQLGHAVLLKNVIDPIEIQTTRQTEAYIGQFQAFIVQNHHMKGYLRFTQPGFPRQQELALTIGRTTLEMNQFIYQVVNKYAQQRLLNRTTLRFLEHHFPETCYFIKKLSYYAPELQQAASQCSLRKPSFPNN